MTNKISCITAIILVLVPLAAAAAEPNAKKPIHSELFLEAGQRLDQLDWNIAGDLSGENPNILSELTWKDLEIREIRAGGHLRLPTKRIWLTPSLRGDIGYGEITAGKNQDSDYHGDNRTLEYSRSNNQADDGSVFDASLGAGLRFQPFAKARLFVTPLLGFSYHEQNLVVTDGLQTLASADSAPLGPIQGLDSSYEAKWTSFWHGVDLEWQMHPKLNLRGAVEFHLASYEAVGNWNLRTDLDHPVSFRHESDTASGMVVATGLKFFPQKYLSIDLDVSYQKWQVAEDDDAIDKVYLDEGGKSITRLNEVNWESGAVRLGLTVYL